jgi:hypothetical protein
LEFAIRQFGKALSLSADAYVFLHQVVVRFEVFVTERPILSEAVVSRGLQVEITEPKRYPTPHIRASTRHTKTT